MGMDVERKGSMGRRTVYPVSSPYTGVAYEPMPPKGRISWLIPLIVVVNVITFIITMAINNCPKNSVDGCIVRFLGRFSFQPFSENPLLGPSSATLQKMGGLKSSLVTDDHQGWRLLTCMWLHGGVFHLLANMLSLVFIGIRLEQEFGFVKVGIVYLLSGFGGSLMSALFIKNQISVGASGALFGLLGAMLSELLTNWSMYNNKCAALTTLIILTVVNLAVGILPHVDNFAHIGGFLTGFLLGFVFLLKPQLGWLRRHETLHEGVEMPVRSKHKAIQYILLITALVILVAGFLAAIILLFKGVDVNKKCTWCHYLSCVPTSAWRCDDQQITCTTSWDKGYLTMTCSNGKTVDWASVTDVNTSNSRLSAYCTKSCA